MSPEREAEQMRKRRARYDELAKLSRAEVVAKARRASRVNGMTERTSKVNAIHFILDSELPVW